jgi:hypothetical protein
MCHVEDMAAGDLQLFMYPSDAGSLLTVLYSNGLCGTPGCRLCTGAVGVALLYGRSGCCYLCGDRSSFTVWYTWLLPSLYCQEQLNCVVGVAISVVPGAVWCI